MTNEKSLGKASPAPGPVPKGLIRIYSMRFCPFAQRTRLVLAAKGIKHETININLRDKPDWFLEKNPLGMVPVLETDAGEVMYESNITSDYLDEVYPGKKLLPDSPYGKAKQRMMLEHFSKVVPLFYKTMSARKNNEDPAPVRAELREKLLKIDESLAKKKTKFFAGDSTTMIDYMAWPFFERMVAFELESLLDDTPELKKYIARMKEDPAVKACAFNDETLKAFAKSAYLEGNPAFDYGL